VDKVDIPIKNIYYLLAYAWDFLNEQQTFTFFHEKFENIDELLTLILIFQVEKLLKDGFHKEYVQSEDLSSRLNGQLLFNQSINDLSIKRLKIWRISDDLSFDILFNQIIKTTLKSLQSNDQLSQISKNKVFEVYGHFSEISTLSIQPNVFRKLLFHSNNKRYRTLIKTCELIYNSQLFNQQDAHTHLNGFYDQKNLAEIFELFLTNFFKKHLKSLQINSQRHILWNQKNILAPFMSKVPIMKADIVIENENCSLVIDAKFYKEMLSKNRFNDFENKYKIRSNHLFQIYSYLDNLQTEKVKKGLLIYPVVFYDEIIEKVPLSIKNNYQTTLMTLNLNQEWAHIEEDLINIVNRTLI
jgi:5-methylcytosine-specific restriction enzyme subunit McrC